MTPVPPASAPAPAECFNRSRVSARPSTSPRSRASAVSSSRHGSQTPRTCSVSKRHRCSSLSKRVVSAVAPEACPRHSKPQEVLSLGNCTGYSSAALPTRALQSINFSSGKIHATPHCCSIPPPSLLLGAILADTGAKCILHRFNLYQKQVCVTLLLPSWFPPWRWRDSNPIPTRARP